MFCYLCVPKRQARSLCVPTYEMLVAPHASGLRRRPRFSLLFFHMLAQQARVKAEDFASPGSARLILVEVHEEMLERNWTKLIDSFRQVSLRPRHFSLFSSGTIYMVCASCLASILHCRCAVLTTHGHMMRLRLSFHHIRGPCRDNTLVGGVAAHDEDFFSVSCLLFMLMFEKIR